MSLTRGVQVGTIAVYLAMLVFPFAASTLLAPAGGVAFLLAGWMAGLTVLVSLLRRGSRWSLAVPPIALAFWGLTVWAGDAWLGWTA